ncbi:MAG TPA: sulfur carrier protein ThiS [Longimicrobium sp.]|jgi:sulfur carrier protein|uniref:sulfur carrier protein ThiS n=1 Tax=Longimicrobium sp. TaxID=2029185 RepID=UPI002ED9F05C
MESTLIPIRLNGAPEQVPAGTLDALLAHRGVSSDNAAAVAVARNGAVVPRRQWADTAVQPGDEVEIVTALQGG